MLRLERRPSQALTYLVTRGKAGEVCLAMRFEERNKDSMRWQFLGTIKPHLWDFHMKNTRYLVYVYI